MKTKFLWFALTVSAATIAQANPGAFHAGTGGSRGGAVARSAPAVRAPMRGGAPAVRAPMRAGGISSFHSAPMRAYGSRSLYSGQRYSSFGMRSSPSFAYRRPYINSNRGSFTRSGPYTVATIPQRNRIAPFANQRNPVVTNVWNQRNAGIQFRNGNNLRNPNSLRNPNNLRNANNLRNGNNHLRAGWQKHVFAQRSEDWHRDWNRNSDHWWNGHRCCFINGSWVIFNVGFYPWWPWYYPDDYYYDYGFPYDGYGSSTYGYGYPYSYNYDPGYYNSGDYQGQMDYDQNSYPDQSQGYYDSTVYQPDAYYDPNGYSDQSQSNYSIVAAAQERLAREGYYRGETDGALSPEMQKAVRRYQITNGLRPTGYLDGDTLAVMGLQKGASY
jgi:putative peptidoglycan binding protein